MTERFWPFYFEQDDPAVTLSCVETRYPFFDLRLAKFLLALPPIPWCLNKTLLRRAMCGILPEPVRLRPKATLAVDPVLTHLQQDGASWIDHYEPTSELADYLDPDMLPLKVSLGGLLANDHRQVQLRSFSLDLWLRQQRQFILNS